MKIRPKKIPIFLNGGVSGVGRTSNDWYNNVHVHQMDAILNKLKQHGEKDDYMYWLNNMQNVHSNIYNAEKDKMDRPEYRDYVLRYQQAYKGNPEVYPYFNLGNIDRRVQLENDTHNDYNQYGILKSFENGIFTYPGKRTSGDSPELNYNPDGYFSRITDYRRLLGREGDWDENSLEFKDWLKKLNELGYETYLDNSTENGGKNDRYYKLRRLPNNFSLNGAPSNDNITRADLLGTKNGELNSFVEVRQRQDPESKWKIFGDKLKNAAPDIIEALRLAGNLHNNNRVYDAVLKGIRPNLLQTYNTYRQVVGDEATKQAYYRRGIAGQTKAGLAFTSDADRQMAYLMEAKRVADELKAQGDLADNAEIRRTSDESNQHQWANIQRATEVANRNLIEMNNANAAKLNLKALKYSADWTNWDNYLMGIQSRMTQKKLEQEAFNRQLAQLDIQDDYINDDILQSLELQRQNLYTQYLSITGTDEESKTKKESLLNQILLKNKEINSRKLELQKDSLKKMYPEYAKSGTKIEYKATDKYLYKTSKDLVEHFRKMSKMADDSRLKSRTKPIKLSSHPKGNTRKYLLGGVAPFTIFRPLGIGGESAIGSQTTSSGSSKSSSSSSSGKDDAAKNKLDLVKELFKSLKGLPVDVNMAYKDIYSLFEKSKLFGEELSTDDIAGIYLNSMRAVSLLLYGQEAYEKAKALATSNEALNEYAVTSDGSYVVSDKDGNLSYKKNLKEIEESGLVPITNLQLINMRAYSPNMVGLRGDTIIENVIGNGMGVNKIGDQIKALAGKIGTSESKLDGISQVESNKVKQGLQILAGAPDGYYKVTTENKTQQAQVNAALSYIENMLSPSQRAILNAHGGTKPLIQAFLTSQLSATENISISPLTGKAAADKDKDSLDKVSSNPLLAMLREIGGNPINYSLVTRDSNTRISVNGTAYPSLPKVDQDMSISKMLSTSGIDGIITSRRGITFGDLQIKPEDLNHIMYSIDGGGTIVTLPCKIVNGVKLVNLDIRESYEKAELRALLVSQDRHSPEFIKALGEELKKEHLDSLLDSNGLPNKNMFALFLLVEGYTTDRIDFKRDSLYVEKVKNPDSSLESRMSLALSTDKKKLDYSIDIDDHWGWFEGTWDDIYRGTIFIPLNNNPNAAINSWGGSVNVGLSTELEELYQNANKSTKFNNNNSL